MRYGRLADRANRPVGGNPFSSGMNEGGGEPDQAAVVVDGGGLNGRDLMLAQALADEIEPGG
jgi:hypothetical protein